MPIPVPRSELPVKLQFAAMQQEHARAKRIELSGIPRNKQAQLELEYVTHHPAMKREVQRAITVRDRRENVLITGESGTGKEILAQIVGDNPFYDFEAGMSANKFLSINCAGISRTLFESELFGHVAGAYTGSKGDRQGYLVAAGQGTVFLDEVGELEMDLQAKLLRAVQNKRITAVGGDTEIDINCRFIFATNRNLKERIRTGHFREDLYYRIAQILIRTIPLRDRIEDVQPIVEELIRRNGWSPWGSMPDDPKIIPAWAYSRGNVRQLENVLLLRELSEDWDYIQELHSEEGF